MNVENKKGFRFNPTISFDGVAVIVGVIMVSIWAGRINERLEATAQRVAEHEQELQQINKTTERLTTLMDEREHRAFQTGKIP